MLAGDGPLSKATLDDASPLRARKAARRGDEHPLLYLQRVAGNAAVASLLAGFGPRGPIVQRFNSFAMDQARDFFSEHKSQAMWTELSQQLAKYEPLEKKDKPEAKEEAVEILFTIEALANEWIGNYDLNRLDPLGVNRAWAQLAVKRVQNLASACGTEIEALQSHFNNLYEGKLQDTNIGVGHIKKKKQKGRFFRYITDAATGSPEAKSPEYKGGTNTGDFPGVRSGLSQQLAENKQELSGHLTDAELAAIRVYSAGDYAMINPVLWKNEADLEANVKGLAGVPGATAETKFTREITRENIKKDVNSPGAMQQHKRDIKIEAMMHTRMAISGLKKLPDIQTPGFRGLGLSADLKWMEQYKPGMRQKFLGFSSTSTDRGKSEAFAAMNGGKTGKVPVLMILQIKKGKNITALSIKPKEGEVLLLPGAEFEVTAAPVRAKSPGLGDHYEITLTQVVAGGDQVPPAAAPAQSPAAAPAQAPAPAPARKPQFRQKGMIGHF